ncbi:hypothetical protein [Lysobacter gummosus]|uniref:hypothetical protein n=1 Tax=Lysobacter gummosus TaxID=262324 RepID=UPI0036439020
MNFRPRAPARAFSLYPPTPMRPLAQVPRPSRGQSPAREPILEGVRPCNVLSCCPFPWHRWRRAHRRSLRPLRKAPPGSPIRSSRCT